MKHIEDTRYGISDEGKVADLWIGRGTVDLRRRKNPRNRKVQFNGSRMVVKIGGRHRCVATLVLLAFVGQKRGGQRVWWKDGDRANNRANNLEWRCGIQQDWYVTLPLFTRRRLRWQLISLILQQKHIGIPALTRRYRVERRVIMQILSGDVDLTASADVGYLISAR